MKSNKNLFLRILIIRLSLIINDACLQLVSDIVFLLWRLCAGLPVGWRPLTKASVAGELLVDLLHALDVEAAGLGVVHHGLGVVHAHNALGRLLHALRCVPGVVDVLSWEAAQDGQVASSCRERCSERCSGAEKVARGGVGLPDVVSIGVGASAEAHRAVTVEELLKEGAAGEPHPAAGIHAPVRVQQQLLKNLQREHKEMLKSTFSFPNSQQRGLRDI